MNIGIIGIMCFLLVAIPMAQCVSVLDQKKKESMDAVELMWKSSAMIDPIGNDERKVIRHKRSNCCHLLNSKCCCQFYVRKCVVGGVAFRFYGNQCDRTTWDELDCGGCDFGWKC